MLWKQSTEQKSLEGKARVAANAWRGAQRQQLRALIKLANKQFNAARELVGCCG